jgi:predicted nucleotidyltransferase
MYKIGGDKMLENHKKMLNKIEKNLIKDNRILGLAVGGSFIENDMDEFSDLDLVIVVDNYYYEDVMSERFEIINEFGELLSAFTGEHVGEPRLVIALFKICDELMHIDFKFVSVNDLSNRVEDATIIFEKNKTITNEFGKKQAEFPPLNYQNIEDKFWIWIHYGTVKIGRGEVFEAIEFISFLRQNVIGPMILVKNNKLPKGVRKIELNNFKEVEVLKKTVPEYSRKSCIKSLEIIIKLYLELREEIFEGKIILRKEAQTESIKYLNQIKDRL